LCEEDEKELEILSRADDFWRSNPPVYLAIELDKSGFKDRDGVKYTLTIEEK
jgi:hypothetical protein